MKFWLIAALRTVVLAIALSVSLYLNYIVGFYTNLLAVLFDKPELLLTSGILTIIILFLEMAYFRQFIDAIADRQPFSWRLSRRGWVEGMNATIVTLVSTIATATIWLPIAFRMAADGIVNPIERDWLLKTLSFTWIAIAILLYRYDASVRSRQLSSKPHQAVQSRSRGRQRDPIDTELGRLRGQLGLTHVKNPKSRPDRSK
ncbi:hypothetical protein JJD41_12820 [Oxynema sp. CENA135]|uniref:hypothetical protein n=1 Tax=Oxynema sp. CENA135 TaxID=984206 RepID=UPI00190DEE58|nr:hypothetical protein [Oxynema sp. CENA135]MBK4730739.1 hypothetical protein [Oxynema sp. CENA135]